MIYLSVGHSGGKVGAVANNTTEFEECNKIVDKVEQELKFNMAKVPTNLDLVPRIAWINKNAQESDVLIELHMDSASPTARGATVFYLSGSDKSMGYATKISTKYCDSVGIKNRGIKGDTQNRHGRLGIVRDTRPMAFLIELGFISNTDDLALVREKAVQGILSIATLFGPSAQPIQADEIAPWAQDAFKRASFKHFSQTNPLDIVGTPRLRKCLVKAGFEIKDSNDPVTYQELVVVLDRDGKFIS